MTGFGRGEHLGQKKAVIVEMKSVNHRYNEVSVKLPRIYSSLEEKVKRLILNEVSRGRIEVYIKIDDSDQKVREVQVDKDLAIAYYKALKELAELTGTSSNVNAIQIAELPDVVRVEESAEDLEEVWQDILPAVSQALDTLVNMRAIEGEKLYEDLLTHIDIINDYHKKVSEKSPTVVSIYRQKLQNRLKELLDEGQIDENRIAMEVAIYADRCSIDEEIVRLKSHTTQFIEILQEDNPIGRKLDFLIQEMNREINTIGSKANDLDITKQVVVMKSELEKLREQIQNIE